MNTDGILPAEPLLAIVAAARNVLRVLSPGLAQPAYAGALAIELRKWPMQFETNRVYEVRYDGELVDVLVAPLVVEDTVLVELRVTADFDLAWIARANTALLTSGLPQALLLNFQHAELAWHPIQRLPVPHQRFA